MTRKYAETTSVPVDRSQSEVRAILDAQGCTKFGLMDDGPRTAIQAVLTKDGASVTLRFVLADPDKTDKEWRFAVPEKIQQERRRRWRCLVVMLKAKFAAVESGIVTFQDEFLAHLVLPGGRTVGEWAGTEIGPAIAAGKMPSRLLLGSGS